MVEVEKKIFNDSQLEGMLGFSSNPLVMNQRLIRLYNNHLLGLMLRIRHTGKIDQPQQTGVLLQKHSEALTDLRNQLESSSELYKTYGYTGYRYINGLESRISTLSRALSGQKCLGADCSDLINTIKTKVNACKN